MSIPGMKSTADFAPDERIGVGVRSEAPLRLLGALPDGEEGVEYFAVIRAAGGRAPYTFKLLNAEGLSVNHEGWLSGVPTAAGNAILRVFSADGQSISLGFVIAADIPEIVYTLFNSSGNVGVPLQQIVGALVAYDNLDQQIQALRLTAPLIDAAMADISLNQPLVDIVASVQGVINQLRAAQPVPATWSADSTAISADGTSWTADGAREGGVVNPPQPSTGFWSSPFWTRSPFWAAAPQPAFSFWSTPFWTRTSFWGA